MSETAHAEMKKQFRWNYTFHCAEGGAFECGSHFIDIFTVLPAIVTALGGPIWLVGMVPALLPIGFMLPTLFSASYCEHLKTFKPFNLIMGLVSRVMLLFITLSIFIWGDSHPLFIAFAVGLTPLLIGIPLGISSPAWYAMIGNMIPDKHLSSSMAIRLGIGTVCGIPIALGVMKILEHHSDTKAYGFLFLAAFGFLLISYILFALLREIPGKKAERPPTLWENLRLAPALIKGDKQLRTFMISIICGGTVFFVVPFLSPQALAILIKPKSFLGILLMWQFGGSIAGNLTGGMVGDIRGAKNVLIIGQAAEVILCILCLFANSEAVFYLIFALVGVAVACERIGNTTLTIELSPEEKRPTYAGIVSAGSLLSMMLSGGLGAAIMSITEGNLTAAAVPGIIFSALSLWFLFQIREPRRETE